MEQLSIPFLESQQRTGKRLEMAGSWNKQDWETGVGSCKLLISKADSGQGDLQGWTLFNVHTR